MPAIAKNTTKQLEVIDNVAVDFVALSQLLERESRIERAQRNAYYEIGLDLKAIRDGDLYKLQRENPVAGRYSFVTFEEYLQERWDWTPQHANGVIRAAEATEKLEAIVSILPSRESHVRELLKVDGDEARAEVWQAVVDRGETVTAKLVEDEVTRYLARAEKNWFTVDEWSELDEEEKQRQIATKSDAQFNKQDNASIEWAQWSWNPVTGCKHDCPYCYARDIANRFYPQKFEPSIYPGRLAACQATKVPQQAATDVAYRNVFVCSMADLFGKWVPEEWIRLVMDCVSKNPQWNFLFLTKFPQRFSELGEFPSNAWLGTTVDCQARVANAEKSFAKLSGGTKWLSVEPMLTRLQFKKLDMFDWVVVGGASRSTSTPQWIPPFDWITELHFQARDAGCSIYHKDNLQMGDALRLKEFPWDHDSRADRELPSQLKYLGME